MFLEYRGELTSGYSFFRGAFDLGDLDRDGAEEMVIADDEGGYHVFKFSPEGFVQMWVSNPLVEDGYIVGVQILHENVPGIMPHILLLDSHGTLHQVRYTGYLFEKTAQYEDYRPPGESGRLMVTDIGGGNRTVLIAFAEGDSEEFPGDDDGTSEEEGTDLEETEQSDAWWSGLTIYRLTDGGLEELTGDELAELHEGEVYVVQGLEESDVSELLSLGATGLYRGSGPDSGLAGLADLDRDTLVELVLSVSDPDRPIDRLEIWSEEEGHFTVKVIFELPLINQMVLGDIDGDGFTEIVGLTFDGVVLVYQWDPLTILLADGSELTWETPHREIDGTIWLGIEGFKGLGCDAEEVADSVEVRRGEWEVTLDRSEMSLKCGEEILAPEVPEEFLEDRIYLPLFSVLNCLGFLYTYDPETNVVRLETEG